MAAQYEYHQLGNTPHRDVFRYMRLHPGTGDDPLACDLLKATLGTAAPAESFPQYEAMSYVWGHAERHNPITCNGKTLLITASLAHTLSRVRRPERPRLLWADSVCINQDDPAEKGHQVGIMGDIYGRATQVLIDLGPAAAQDTSAVASFLKAVGKLSARMSSDRLERDARLHSLQTLFAQPWFQRVWVVQEAARAQRATVLWGDVQIHWDDLMRVHQKVYNSSLLRLESAASMSHGPARLHGFFWEVQRLGEIKARNHSFLQILSLARSLHATDERDRIFAFIRIASGISDATRWNWTPDYTVSFHEIYVALAKDDIQARGHAEILRYVQHDTASLHCSMPSWVPRWDLCLFQDVALLAPDVHTVDCRRMPLKQLVVDDHLILQSLLIGKIVMISNVMSASTVPGEILEIWREASELGVDGPCPYPKTDRSTAFLDALSLCTSWKTALIRYLRDLQGRTAYLEQMQEIISATSPGLGAKDDAHLDGADRAQEISLPQSRYHHELMTRTAANRRFIVTHDGYYGTVPPASEVGDICTFLPEAGASFVLRETKVAGHYKVIGETYMVPKKRSSGRPTSMADPPAKHWMNTLMESEEEIITIV